MRQERASDRDRSEKEKRYSIRSATDREREEISGERVSLGTKEGGKGEYSSGRVGRRLMFQKLLSV